LTDEEHKSELVNKIIEEANEINQATSDNIAEEIADVQQAIDDLKDKYSLSDLDIQKAKATKRKKSGSFAKGIYIDHVTLAENDQWTKYFRKNSDRYPEI
jgi:predicted house-cleaning noncanonical NTP pyrophosphatase (MazG superfamily)